MSFRSTLALLVLLVLLIGGYYAMLSREETTRRQRVEAQRAFTHTPDELVRISIQQEDRRPTLGVRTGDEKWTIEEPYSLRAYHLLWNRVARNLAELSNERIVEEAVSDLATYDFHDPRLVVEAQTADGQELTIVFGKAGPTQTNRYALINDGLVTLIDDDSYFELNRSLDLLRHHHLFDYDPDEGVHRVEFAWIWTEDSDPAEPEGPIPGDESMPVVVEYEDDTWYMLEPEPGPVHHETVMEFVNGLLSETCKHFVDEPESLADYGLDPARARATLITAPGAAPQTVYFGDQVQRDGETRIFAKWADEPTVFTVRQGLRSKFPSSPTAFRERRLLTTEAKQLRLIEIDTADALIRLERDDRGGWMLTEPTGYATDQRAVSEFIGVLTHLEGREHVTISPEEAGLDEPRAAIRLQAEGDETPRVIRIGDPTPDGETCYVTQDTGTPLTLSAAIGDNLAATELFRFRAKELVQFIESEIAEVHLTLDGNDYRFEHTGRAWRVREPEDHVWDSQADMEALLDAINPVRAVSLEASDPGDDLGHFGLETPMMTLAFTMTDNDISAPAVLHVGSVAPDNSRHRFAKLEGISEIYRIRQAHIDDLRQAIQGVRPR